MCSLIILCPLFDFLFVYDQSSGRIKLREDGRVSSNMNMSYDRVLTHIHNTTIKDLGPYDCAFLNIGSSQSMVFDEEDL